MKKMLLYTVVLSLVPLWAQAQYTWNNTGSISTSSTCSASINNGSIVTNSSGAICQCSNVVASTYNWNCSASASSGTEVKVNGGSALTTSNQTGVLPYLCSDTSGSGSTQFCSTTPSFTPQAGNCITYMTTTSPSGAVTLNVNSLGAKTVRIWQGGSIYAVSGAPYNYPSGAPMAACYDGTYWNIGAANASTVVQTNGGPVQISNQTGALPYLCADTSTSGTAQSCTTTPGFTPQTGNCVVYSTTTANSGTGLTVNINSLGAKSVAVAGSSGWTTTLVTSSSIPSNKPMHLCYDGTNWDASGTGFAATGGGGGGGGLNGVNAQTTSYTAVSGDNGKAITFNCASACTITMPTSVPANGWTIFASNESANAILSVVPTSGSNLYLGTGTAALGTGALNSGMGVSIWSDGTNYHVNQGGVITGSNIVPYFTSNFAGAACTGGGCGSTISFPNDVTPGDAIVLHMQHSNGTITGPSDAQGDTFTLTNTQLVSGEFDWFEYVVCGAIGGPTTINLGSSADFSVLAVYEATNVATSSCVDGYKSSQCNEIGTACTGSLSTGSVTTTQANDLLMVTGGTRTGTGGSTMTEGNGYAVFQTVSGDANQINYQSFQAVKVATGSVSDTVSYTNVPGGGYAGMLALKPTTTGSAIVEGDVIVAGPLGQLQPLHAGPVGFSLTSNGPNTMPSYSSSFGGTITYTTSQTASIFDNGRLVVMDCSSACAYTLPATQPNSTWNIRLTSQGLTTATVVLGGSDTFNGSASVPVLNPYEILSINANSALSTDYLGNAPLVAGSNMTFSPSSNGLSIAASGGGGGGGPTIQTHLSNTIGTVYHNTGTTARWVQVSVLTSASNQNVYAYSDSSSTPTANVGFATGSYTSGTAAEIFFIVLAGNYYEISCSHCSEVLTWYEWQ